jgi:hypothetical protein
MRKPTQLPLIRSPSYESFYQHMIEVWRLKPEHITRVIENDLPWLLDPYYIRPEIKRK